MGVPTWLGATSGQPGQAGQVNQFLAAHAVTYVYTGVKTAAQTTAGAGGFTTATHWIAQSFATASGQTTIGWVSLALDLTGTPAPTTVSIQANSASAPSGTALVSSVLPKEFVTGSFAQVNIMLPVTGLTASATYWIVVNQAGDASDYFSWEYSNQTSGCSLSTNGTSWTAQSQGLLYQVYDQTAAGPLTGTWEDSGARWTGLSYTSGLVTGLTEYTAGQTAAGYTAGKRTLSYSSGLLTGVA